MQDIKISSLCFFLDQQKFARKHMATVPSPFLVVAAAADEAVRNSTARDFVGKAANGPVRNHYVEFAGADHPGISYDPQYYPRVQEEVLKFFASLEQE